ncbi:hypothetical protein [Desulfobulbus elongatus]|uniref:hypothetical protein n=1 Tax=Desulfobulbus elongatus TaxID=53332 RepID=UPI0004837B2C|nr:hypothetical protein [Desulfobulbus elongatus]
MINLMTLDATHLGPLPETFSTLVPSRDADGIDLLCCQSVPLAPDGRAACSRWLPTSLGLTCSCFAVGRPGLRPVPDAGQTAGGLAIFTGNTTWVLNSGSFTIGEEDETTLVQFALVRKHGASLLALNLHLGASRTTQLRQLRHLFAHALLREPYGAVALCADRAAVLTGKQWQQLTTRSNYTLHRTPLTAPGVGLLGLFTARFPAVSAVTVRQPEPAAAVDAGHAPNLPALAMTVDIQRIGGKSHRPLFPLSFREQWLGYREHRAFA